MNLDYSVSCILLGDSGTGKSSLLELVTTKNKLNCDDYIGGPTIGVDFSVLYITINDACRIKMQIWDTAGQERFFCITNQYVRKNSIVFFVYDITNYQSFLHIRDIWLPLTKERLHKQTKYVLIGNKCDKPRVVPKEVAKNFADLNHMYFTELSIHSTPLSDITYSFSVKLYEIVDDIENDIISPCDFDMLGIKSFTVEDNKKKTKFKFKRQQKITCCNIC